MKKLLPILAATAVLIGAGVYFSPPKPDGENEAAPAAEIKTPSIEAEKTEPEPVQPPPKPVIEKPADIPPPQITAIQPKPEPEIEIPPEPPPPEPPRPNYNAYWEQQERSFKNRMEQLANETDPAKREALIRQLGQYVRIDTLAAINWAMSLEDPEEQRMALEAINQNALTGIGARIEMGERGYPQIRDTTVLSAVGATGMVKSGDYITGIRGADGQTIHFKGMSLQQIVQYLRGQPGTEITLNVERIPETGSQQPIVIDVPIQRSLIVMDPELMKNAENSLNRR